METKIEKYTNQLLVLLVLLLSVSITQAQPPGGQQGGQQGPPPLPNDEEIEQMVNELSKELALSEEQERQVSDVYFAHFEEVEAVVGNGNSRPDRELMEKMKKDFETDVKCVLTKDQKKTYNVYLKQQEQQRGRGQGRPQR